MLFQALRVRSARALVPRFGSISIDCCWRVLCLVCSSSCVFWLSGICRDARAMVNVFELLNWISIRLKQNDVFLEIYENHEMSCSFIFMCVDIKYQDSQLIFFVSWDVDICNAGEFDLIASELTGKTRTYIDSRQEFHIFYLIIMESYEHPLWMNEV